MQGLWSTHRRSKINLNSLQPQTPGTVSEPGTPRLEDTSGAITPPTEQLKNSSINPINLSDNQDSPAIESNLKPASTKRKLRSSRLATGEESSKRYKATSASEKDYSAPSARLADVGGSQACIEKLLELVAMPLCHPEIYLHTGVQPPRGVLLHGPPGCGKTLLANAIAGVCNLHLFFSTVAIACAHQELGVPFISVSAPSIVSGMSGESEKTLRDTFEEAKVAAFIWYNYTARHSYCF